MTEPSDPDDPRQNVDDDPDPIPEPPEPPVIEVIQPSPVAAGNDVTITGGPFGSTAKTVTFRADAPGFPSVRATTSSWRGGTIVARVPSLAALTTAGRMELTVTLSSQLWASDYVTVLGSAPPSVSGLDRAAAPPGDVLRILGQNFGVGPAGEAVVFRSTPSEPGTAANVLSCRPTEIRVIVPAMALGAKTITVQTAWGNAAPVTFTVAERPSIAAVTPTQTVPDGRITITGSGFGTGSVPSVVLRHDPAGAAPPFEVALEVESSTPTQIRAYVPGIVPLRTTGAKELIVRTDVGASAPAAFTVLDTASITTWTRIEPHARDQDRERTLRTGLAAEVADPLWLLARQWVLGELQATDGGSPVQVVVQGEAAPLARWRPGASGTPADVPRAPVGPGGVGGGPLPLEAVVEREQFVAPSPPTDPAARAFPDRRAAVEAGLQLLRHLGLRVTDATQAAAYRQGFVTEYPVQLPPAGELRELDPDSRRFLDVMAGRAPDGETLYRTLRSGQLPARPAIGSQDAAQVIAAIDDWLAWCGQLVSQPLAGADAWSGRRMEYSFAVAAETPDGEVVLGAPEYSDGRLDWHAFVRQPGQSLRAGTTSVRNLTRVGGTAVPAPVTYPGMPLPRWWEMEDRQVDFGGLQAGASELLRMLLIEFATVFGNDWLVVPVVGVPAGSLVQLTSVRVRDTFGIETPVLPFSRSGPGTGWRMYELAAADGTLAPELLMLPSVVNASLESAPIERVALARDELANMGWAIEGIVPSATGRPLDRHEDDQAKRRRDELAAQERPPARRPAVAPEIAYRLATVPPPQWIPLLPATTAGVRTLVRGAFRAPDGSGSGGGSGGSGALIVPRGRILEPGKPLTIADEEVPRAGAEVVRTWQVARGPDGTTHLWIGRRKQGGQGEVSSGLRFDTLVPNPPPAPTPPRSTARPEIAGLARADQLLVVSSGEWAGTEPLTFAYRWRRCNAAGGSCVDVPGATGAQLELAPADVGATFRVVVTATSAQGSATAESAATAVVAPFVAPTATVAPAVEGDAIAGATLSATSGTWAGTEPITLEHRWRRSGAGGGAGEVDIAGATGSTYVLGPDDVGRTVQVVVTARNPAGSATVASPPTATVRTAPAATELPVVQGTPALGHVLTATAGTWSGTPPITLAYQWRRDGAPITGATSAAYTVAAADLDTVPSVAVTATNTVGTAVATAASSRVVAPPTSSAVPVVSGTARLGQVLTATAGTWSGSAPIVTAYQWQRGTADIAGATGASYTVTTADLRWTLRVVVRADNAVGTALAASNPTARVEPPPAVVNPPAISGWTVSGQQLTATTGTWSGTAPITYAYQWQRANASGGSPVDVAGATAASYTLVAADVGATLRVKVTASNPGGSVIATSGATAVIVAAAPPAATAAPTVSGAPEARATLTATQGTWSGTNPRTFAYRWRRTSPQGGAGADIPGATAPTYVPTTTDVGGTLRVVVSCTNPVGSASATSAPTPPIVPAQPPVNVAAPVIAGDAATGLQLAASSGQWTSATPLTYAYQWVRYDRDLKNGVDIPGATAATYTPVAADAGSRLVVTVKASNAGGTTAASSNPTAVVKLSELPVNKVAPAITGEPLVGHALTAVPGTWEGTQPLVFDYRWLRNNPDGKVETIEGATGTTYVPVGPRLGDPGDVGSTLQVAVTATNGAGSVSATSAATRRIEDPDPSPTPTR